MITFVREVAGTDLERINGSAGAVYDLFRRDDPSGRVLSLEKAWHGLHALLTGTAWGGAEPLGFLVAGGEAVGPPLSYGPARLLRHDFVRRLDDALQGISDVQLWSRYDPARFEAEGVYPGVWDEPVGALREEYVAYFNDLKAFVHRARLRGGELVVATL